MHLRYQYGPSLEGMTNSLIQRNSSLYIALSISKHVDNQYPNPDIAQVRRRRLHLYLQNLNQPAPLNQHKREIYEPNQVPRPKLPKPPDLSGPANLSTSLKPPVT